MRRKVVKISLLMITLMISFVLPIIAVTAKKKEWVSGPVYIDETMPGMTWADWVDEPWLKGSGTEEDPYMIKNLVIDAGGNFFCMMIMNSDAFFKIMDCTFSNTGPGPDAGRNAALILVGTQNGVIFKNEILNCGIPGFGQGSGIALISSSNNKVQKNFCHDNGGPGIYLQYSNDNVIRQNLCERNQWGIMIAEWSNNNEVTKNDCYNNNAYGIILWTEANNNLITENDCKENFLSGIFLVQSHGNIIADNDCSENGNGIIITYSNGNEVIDNVCSENFLEHGILVMTYAADNTIARNRCFKNQRSGIVLYDMAYNNLITDNICYENFESGIVIDSSFLNTVENNLAYENGYTGMQIYNAENNRVAWNTFSENYIGLHIISDYNHWMNSNYNEITNNICNENSDSGILMDFSNGNFISENNCSGNVRPNIYLISSNDNLITQNLCTGSGWGIVLRWSSNNEVTMNDCIENGEGIVLQQEANDNRITDNTCTNNYENGILLVLDANYNIIDQNNCSENLLSGVALMSSSGTVISENDCNNNGESGISINDFFEINARDNILYGNNIENNVNGIHFSEADLNDVFMNTIKENDIGMLVEGQSELNLIYHNNFIDNGVQASNEHAGLNNWHSIYMLEGNFWSDYTGTDSDEDGIGDTPWPEEVYDVYPFMEENGWETTTPIEDELLNAWFYPDFNRLGGGRTVHANKTTYIMVGSAQLFSERTHDEWSPPYTCRLWFGGFEYPFQGTLWFFLEETVFGEPAWFSLFYMVIPPNYFTDLGLPLETWYEFQWELTWYAGGEQQVMTLTSTFYLI